MTREHPLSSTEVARRLRVSRETVAKLVDSGELEGHRVGPGRVIKVRPSALEHYLLHRWNF